MRILVLGGYGLIGTVLVRRLIDAGHAVTGLGRDVSKARLHVPEAAWIRADLARLTTPTSWAPVLAEAKPDAIVNSAGVLADGARDDVAAVQLTAMRALYAAASTQGVTAFVQISATRAGTHADTLFMRTKGEADSALAQTTLDWTVLRPGLVLAPQAYGGTALLRALAAVPLVQPLAYPNQPLQTVHVDDVADAVARVLAGTVPTRQTYDLVEDQPHTLREIVAKLRTWLGVRAARGEIVAPAALAALVGRVADGLSWLGWRSPLRTTALREIAAGVSGDPGPWRRASGASLSSLDASLRRLPSTAQERWFARLFLLKPIAIATLSLFWIATGLVALANPDAAARVLTARGFDAGLAWLFVTGGAIADLALGTAIAFRAWLKPAALGMIGLTLAYLAGGTLFAPDLWADPLGPLVKPIPAMVLALVVLALADDR